MENETIYWKQKNGKLISVDDMDIDHLRNTLKMILRNAKAINIKKQVSSFKLNGDMAQSFNDDIHASEIEPDDTHN